MARPKAKGVEYFPLDVGFLSDLKIRKIMLSCGASSIAVLIYIFAAIYRDEGYFMNVKDDDIALIALDTNLDTDYVKNVINRACEVGLFSFRIYDNFRVLTSEGIQNRYLKITERRKSVKINADINLVNVDMMYTETRVNVAETIVNVAETPVNVYKSTQSKVKESKVKVKESKVKKSKEKNTVIQNDVFSTWLNTFGDISSFIKETLETLTDEYGPEQVIEAIEITHDRGKTSIKYVEGVLKNKRLGNEANRHNSRAGKVKEEAVDWQAEYERVHGKG
ncbi:Lin1244/Lin1753 domain-containing protein [Veillonella parvula]|uniref:Lin1244/Lin1753 domain-containing protein n=1 Tax=Veillonella parvula TaxID=29466 RepID=UPI00265E99BE|nr:Lin1244/Lin1753 domain-containing protein [Veillonella parvula]